MKLAFDIVKYGKIMHKPVFNRSGRDHTPAYPLDYVTGRDSRFPF